MLTALAIISAAWWVGQVIILFLGWRATPVLASLEAPAPALWPKLTMVVPARDEAESIEGALAAKLSEGYPALEVMVVNDRSTDQTGAIAERCAAGDSRVRVTHISALPEGWLGKVHALQRGLEQSSGEWILFSDADVHLAPGTMTRLVAWAEANQVDHIAILPQVSSHGLLLSPVMTSFLRLFCTLIPLFKVSDPRSKVAVGSGGFNLFRRSALARTPGLEWLKMDIADDMALGMMLKQAGGAQRVIVSQELVSLKFYPTMAVLCRALEKNGASGPAGLTIGAALVMGLVEAGWVAGAFGPLWWLAGSTYGVAMVTQWAHAHWLRVARWPAMVPGLGAVVLAGVVIRATILALMRGGVVWRGTFYSSKIVRQGMHFGRLRRERA